MRQIAIAKVKTNSDRSAYHHGDLRHALLRAALEVSVEDGPQNISFREIARKLGVTTAAPYHHFADKNELLMILAVEGFSLLLSQLGAADEAAASISKKIEALTKAYLRFGREQRGHYRLMFNRENDLAHCMSELKDPAGQCFELVCRAVMQSNKKLSLEQATERTIGVWSFLHGMLVLSASGPLSKRLPRDNEDRLAVETVRRIVTG
jgi:AcrR family transcriptional regulator